MILVTGGRGQLGRALVRSAKAQGLALTALGSSALDIANGDQVAATLTRIKPTLVINAAAYTAVDRAETERERAFAINATAAGALARECQDRRIRIFHISTDYVFEGTSARPYHEDDPTCPLNVYGASKAAGEELVRDAGGIVVRTSWLFAAGGSGFVQRIVQKARTERVLRVVADQVGRPTCADDLSSALLAMAARRDVEGVYHFCGDGDTTWYAFAAVIVAEARRHVPLACDLIQPIESSELSQPARRPRRAVLDTRRIAKLGILPRAWHVGLRDVIAEDLGS